MVAGPRPLAQSPHFENRRGEDLGTRLAVYCGTGLDTTE